MDRRYVCTQCGVKWFIPASQPARPDLTECPDCHGSLKDLPAVSSRPILAPQRYGRPPRHG